MIKTSTLSINSTLISKFLNENHPNESNMLYFTDSPYDFSIKNILLIIFLVLLALSTIFGNIFVILAIFVDFHLRSPTHYMMGSLALADLLLGKLKKKLNRLFFRLIMNIYKGVLVLPFSSTQLYFDKWPFGEAFCEIWLCK